MTPTLKTWVEVIVSAIFVLAGGNLCIRGADLWPEPWSIAHIALGMLIIWHWGDRLGEAWRRL